MRAYVYHCRSCGGKHRLVSIDATSKIQTVQLTTLVKLFLFKVYVLLEYLIRIL